MPGKAGGVNTKKLLGIDPYLSPTSTIPLPRSSVDRHQDHDQAAETVNRRKAAGCDRLCHELRTVNTI